MTRSVVTHNCDDTSILFTQFVRRDFIRWKTPPLSTLHVSTCATSFCSGPLVQYNMCVKGKNNESCICQLYQNVFQIYFSKILSSFLFHFKGIFRAICWTSSPEKGHMGYML